MRPLHFLTQNCTRFAAALVLLMAAMCSSSDAAILIYSANLSGAAEAPPNNSPATGFSLVTLDTTLNTMRVQASFSGLTGNTTAAHIHAPTTTPGGTAGVATTTPSFVGFPLGVTSGSMDQTYDMTLATSYRAAFINDNGGTTATAFAALSASLAAGTAYFNIHTATFGGGEIRGFLTAVPEPSSLMLTGIGLVGLGAGYRRKRA